MTTETLTLSDFLLARYAELERRAEAATRGAWDAVVLGSEGYDVRAPNPDSPIRRIRVARCGYEKWEVDRGNAEHIAAHGPECVLADIEAKRRIVETFADMDALPAHERTEQRETLRWVCEGFASVYADHPDYRKEWAL